MPSEDNRILAHQPQHDQQQPQVKVCSSCQCALVDSTAAISLPELDALVCTGCREHGFSARGVPMPLDSRRVPVDVGSSFAPSITREEAPVLYDTRRKLENPPFDDTMVMDSVSETGRPCQSTFPPSNCSNQPTSMTIFCETNDFSDLPLHPILPSSISSATAVSRRQSSLISSPDPLTDITRLRIRSQGHHCLYPGATFQGTQKSGRNSYDVNVTVVDVDFTSSFLCGYLRIRGLTDDWPELTTYFDAEIIGSQHGFLTQNWGATEQEDMVHWSRFPAFRHVKNELKKPYLTMPDRDRGAVFMRWKERFLVPDHRVQDINGASFAGFYYVCVDFNPTTSPPSNARVTSQQVPLTPESESMDSPFSHSLKQETVRRARCDSSFRQTSGRAPSINTRPHAPTATMSGFYYHQNSEPYQQLSLSHVRERASSSFEFR